MSTRRLLLPALLAALPALFPAAASARSRQPPPARPEPAQSEPNQSEPARPEPAPPAATEITALEMRQEGDRTTVRLDADGRLEPVSARRAEDLFLISLPGVDLSRIAGSWELETREIVGVGIGGDLGTGPGTDLGLGPDGEERIAFELAPGVSCDFRLPESGLEVSCRALGESAAPPSGDAPPGEGPSPAPEAESPRSEAGHPERPRFGGDPVTLDFRDADLRDVLRVLSEVSGLDFVLQPGVSGRVSLRLTETPWDQALDVILRSHGLGHLLDGGVLRVGALADLAAEQMDRQRHEEQRELSGELVTLRRTLAFVEPEQVRELLESRLSERGTLIADPRTGTVLMTDIGARVREIESVLDALDIPVPGVEIEARIVLATRTLRRSLGIQWGGGLVRDPTGKKWPGSIRIGGDAIGGSGASFSAAGGGGGVRPPPDGEGGRPGYGVDLPISGAPAGALGIAMGALGGAAHLDIALSAAERKGEVTILSAPRIVAQNARPATIKQGVTFPVQVVANNTVTVQFRDAVLELTVTPQVSSGGTVLLDLRVSNDSLDFGQAVGGIPSIVTQHATTRVRVEDGATTVIGGVFAARESEDRGRVPGLHRIPLLGHLFRSREQNRRNEELLIFLTPRIRRNGAFEPPPAP